MRWAPALLLLAACSAPQPPPVPEGVPEPVVEQIVADAPLPSAVAAVADAVSAPVNSAIEALSPSTPPPVPAPRNAECRRLAAELIVRWEVTSPSYYQQRLVRPIWPQGASGVTWGIGYDGGHQTRVVILDDWLAHEHRERLATTAGITGQRAGAILPQYRDILTPYDYAYRVFEERSLIEYERRTERGFSTDLSLLRPGACAALVSLVYNRGASMTGDSRREMKAIRDTCLPAADYACIAREIRSMKRLWIGTVNERGLSARRDMEAAYVERI